MADTNPALETTQQRTVNALEVVGNELMIANGFDQKAMDARSDNYTLMEELASLQEEAILSLEEC